MQSGYESSRGRVTKPNLEPSCSRCRCRLGGGTYITVMLFCTPGGIGDVWRRLGLRSVPPSYDTLERTGQHPVMGTGRPEYEGRFAEVWLLLCQRCAEWLEAPDRQVLVQEGYRDVPREFGYGGHLMTV